MSTPFARIGEHGFSAAMMLLLVVSAIATAQEVRVVEALEDGKKVAPKQGVALPEKPFPPENAMGRAGTFFAFHPGEPVATVFSKNVKTNVVNPSPFTHNYSENEIHGTTGKATYDIGLAGVIENGVQKFVTRGSVTGEITPGMNKGEKVLITAQVRDPFTFSDSNSSAQFDFAPGGLDYSFSLLRGTAFPAIFAPNLDSFGALAAETMMVFTGRVAPGVNADPVAFWSDGLSGAIDLYTLTLTSDSNHHITPVLSFARGTSQFTLDYKNQSGVSFDPFDPVDMTVNLIEALIASAFAPDGTLGIDLSDLFTVGFVPTGPTEFTLGGQDLLVLGAAEVQLPEPGMPVLVATSILALLVCRWRRKDFCVTGRVLLMKIQSAIRSGCGPR